MLTEKELLTLGYRRVMMEDIVPGAGCYFSPSVFTDKAKLAEKARIALFTPLHTRYRVFREWRKPFQVIYTTHPNSPAIPHETSYDIAWLTSGRYIVPFSLILEGVEW